MIPRTAPSLQPLHGKQLPYQHPIFIGGLLLRGRDPPLRRQLRRSRAVLPHGKEPNFGLRVADVKNEQHNDELLHTSHRTPAASSIPLNRAFAFSTSITSAGAVIGVSAAPSSFTRSFSVVKNPLASCCRANRCNSAMSFAL